MVNIYVRAVLTVSIQRWRASDPWWQGDSEIGKGKRVFDYLSRVPADQTLILELSADKGPTVFDLNYSPDGSPYKNDYWGHNWVWCLLHNYGQ